MIKLPKTISILDSARLLNCPVGIIAIDMGLSQVRGNEMLATSGLLERYKCPKELFADFISGADRLLTKEQAANMLGIRAHCLNVIHRSRATIVPVLAYGDGHGRGFRYSRKAVEQHLALEAVQGIKQRKPRAKPRKRKPRVAPVQCLQNETQPLVPA